MYNMSTTCCLKKTQTTVETADTFSMFYLSLSSWSLSSDIRATITTHTNKHEASAVIAMSLCPRPTVPWQSRSQRAVELPENHEENKSHYGVMGA